MRDRILKNWTLARGFYVLVGTIIIVNSYMDEQWYGILFGAYFAAMGVFSFGCASGNCAGGNCEVKPTSKEDNPT
ncbi:MAG: hypothetical protein COB73_07495 [Flavobacteriaceae bacterium]|nr:MAG: hypothetical protein COB73_07495 [Flavobacteriaceae bacterium]